jgi:hypothetical protein
VAYISRSCYTIGLICSKEVFNGIILWHISHVLAYQINGQNYFFEVREGLISHHIGFVGLVMVLEKYHELASI